jgi:hypothetical protein
MLPEKSNLLKPRPTIAAESEPKGKVVEPSSAVWECRIVPKGREPSAMSAEPLDE